MQSNSNVTELLTLSQSVWKISQTEPIFTQRRHYKCETKNDVRLHSYNKDPNELDNDVEIEENKVHGITDTIPSIYTRLMH